MSLKMRVLLAVGWGFVMTPHWVAGTSSTLVSSTADGLLNEALPLTSAVKTRPITDQIPHIQMANIVTQCGFFIDLQIPFNQFKGVYYVINSTGLGFPQLYVCRTSEFKDRVSDAGSLNTIYTYWSPDHSNYLQLHYQWTQTTKNTLIATRTDDPSLIYIVARVAWIKDVGIGLVTCSFGNVACPYFEVTIRTFSSDPRPEHIQDLTNQMRQRFVPIGELSPVDHTNCPAIPNNNTSPPLIISV